MHGSAHNKFYQTSYRGLIFFNNPIPRLEKPYLYFRKEINKQEN